MEAQKVYLPYISKSDGGKVFHVAYYNEQTHAARGYLLIKRMMDIFCSLLSILIFSPLLVLISVLVKATSRGPTIYKQRRIGRNGRLFIMYKFRTMVDGAETLDRFLSPEQLESYRINRKLANDPRITGLGGILRKTSLDELPQIFNILKGNMSIVGPRPMMPEEIEMYGESYDRYITVKPGLTGLWQIMCRNRTKMRDRAKLDDKYIEKASMSFDLFILLKTFGVVCSKKGAC